MNQETSIVGALESKQPTISIEFFPPKTEEGARQILKTAGALQPYGISFASVTYGAGGSTRERTVEYGKLLQQLFHYRVVPHLTCVGHSRTEMAATVDGLVAAGFSGVMALRGDPPHGDTVFRPAEDGLAHASELVALIRERHGRKLAIGVAGYPCKHPEAPDADTDLRWLAHKVNQGADFITTQLFFDNTVYFSFVARCRAVGITVPILPGILPLLSLEQARKFTGTTGAGALPPALEAKLGACGDDALAAREAGVEWAFDQVRELLEGGAPGFHLYILNRAKSALALFTKLREAGLTENKAPV
ncbi:MAG: methylenetetrahydrofolate reductase [Puniceicoccales bacterium]|jgi:methylenetetrahydrofolate reductase (NADPH)|nr:methylenetetrahydrofolate reductase [Puniceicoccales bacterium]